MPNNNCLEGMRCPKCAEEGPFRISVFASALVFDGGIDDFREVEWRDDAACACILCDYLGTVTNFRTES